MDDKLLLGFDIGGTKIGIGLGTVSGEILAGTRFNNVNTDPDAVLPELVRQADALLSQCGRSRNEVAAFGISAPFPADARNGIMLAPPNNPLWVKVPILGYLQHALALPGCFENDANCGALAEWFFGSGKGCENFIFLTMSTGIGGGIIANGKLVRGGGPLSAGEIGHTCIQLNGRQCNCGIKGCYEAYCGGRAVAQRLREELPEHRDSLLWEITGGNPEKADMIALTEAVKRQDAYALALWDEISLRNAQALGSLINTFNPEKLILGTMAWAIGDLYLDPIRKKLPAFCWAEPLAACEILPSTLREKLGSYAGIAAALNYLKETGKL